MARPRSPAPSSAPRRITTYPYCDDTSTECPLAILGTGTASTTTPRPFWITLASTENQRSGQLFYGLGQTGVPFLGGTLCVQPPLVRTPVQGSGGSTLPTEDCSGSFAFDFNAWIQAGGSVVAAGQRIDAQYWVRDPSAAQGASLSNGLDFLVLP